MQLSCIFEKKKFESQLVELVPEGQELHLQHLALQSLYLAQLAQFHELH
jgi:hypothetical protein